MPGVSETYLTDGDDGEAALRREAAAAARAEAKRYGEIERTPSANDAFAAKMKAWREGRSIPGYIGPRAAR